MSAPPTFAYRLVRWLSRRALRWHYRDVVVVGEPLLPREGPLLVLVTHPNDLPDVLLGFAVASRPLRYVATASAARERIADATYRALGVIPVSRVKDARAVRAAGGDPRAVNAIAFARGVAAFQAGDVVAGFPEGGVHDGPHLGPLRTGLARMALAARDAGASPIRLVLVALEYEQPRTWRSDVLVAISAPFALDGIDVKPHEPADVAVMRTVQERYWRLGRLAATAAERDRRRALAAVEGAVAAPRGARSRRAALARAYDAWCAPLPAHDAVLAAHERVAQALDAVAIERTAAGDVALALGAVEAATSGGSASAPREAVRERVVAAARVLLTAPLALLGATLNAPAWWLVARLARRVAGARLVDLPARRIVPGLYVVLAWYALLAIVAGGWVSVAAGGLQGVATVACAFVLLAVLAPRLGDLALTLRDAQRDRRLIARVRRHAAAHPAWTEATCAAIATLRDAVAAGASTPADGRPAIR